MSKLFDPNYLKFLCKKYGLVPSRKYGQNFLISPEPVEKMIEAAEISPEDTIVEVGPGFGVLTFALAEKTKEVTAFEIEKKLMPYWDGILKQVQDDKPKNIKIIWGNVLKNQNLITEKKYKVIANLPYQITSNLIRIFLEAENKPQSMVLMVQKEVAERICAKPGDMSVLSVSVQYFGRPEIITNVPRSFFWPEPNVDSAVIKISIHEAHDTNRGELFFKIVKAGFASKRKMLIKNLEVLAGKNNKTKLLQIFKELGLNEKCRAQELSVGDWGKLAEATYPLIC